MAGTGTVPALIVIAAALAGCAAPGPEAPPVPPTPPEDASPRVICDPRCNVLAVGTPDPTNEPMIAVNPRDPLNLVAGANDYTGTVRDSWLGYYWSLDGGKTWGRGLVPGCPECPRTTPPSPLTGYTVAGDAVVAFDEEGNAYLSGLVARRGGATFAGSALFVAKSTNKGESFDDIRLVVVGDGTAAFHDKEWIATGPGGKVYIVWTMYTGSTVANIMFSRSDDAGAAWIPPVVVSNLQAAEIGGQGAQPVVGSDGTLYVAWHDSGRSGVLVSKSGDDGETWSAPALAAATTAIPSPLPNSRYRQSMLPAFAIHRSLEGDTLYAAWNDYRDGNSDILLVRSDDGGESWGEPVRVNDDEGEADQFMPAISVSARGAVGVMFYDRREDPENALVKVYYAHSDAGGAFVGIPLTDAAFDGDKSGGSFFGQVTMTGGPFMGDYLGLADGPDYAVGIWADTRNSDDINTDLYIGRVRMPGQS